MRPEAHTNAISLELHKENSSRDWGALTALPTTESRPLTLLSEAPPPAHAFGFICAH